MYSVHLKLLLQIQMSRVLVSLNERLRDRADLKAHILEGKHFGRVDSAFPVFFGLFAFLATPCKRSFHFIFMAFA